MTKPWYMALVEVREAGELGELVESVMDYEAAN